MIPLAWIAGGVSLSLVDILVLIVVVAACVAIVWIALRAFGIAIPPWVVSIFWVVVVALVAVLAIRFVAGLF